MDMVAAIIFKAAEGFEGAVTTIDVDRCATTLEDYHLDHTIDIIDSFRWIVLEPVGRLREVFRWKEDADAEGRPVLRGAGLREVQDFIRP